MLSVNIYPSLRFYLNRNNNKTSNAQIDQGQNILKINNLLLVIRFPSRCLPLLRFCIAQSMTFTGRKQKHDVLFDKLLLFCCQ